MKIAKKSAQRTASDGQIKRLCALFELPIHEDEGRIFVGKPASVGRHLEHSFGDSTGLEAFVNHVHPADVYPGTGRALAVQMGLAIMHVWSMRLLPLLNGRTILFYLSGRRAVDVTLRFHVERGEPHWTDLDDAAFIRRARLRVYRLSANGLAAVEGPVRS